MPLNFITDKLSLISYLIANGIEIPHYCYHNDLSIAGNCRICIVELNTVIKPIVSCAANAQTAVQSNKIYYDSPLVKKSRENILEFLLLNHPLDCPICDQGGDCDLQDQSLFFGITRRRFHKFKRIVNDKELGPVIKTVMTRCIHCTRCVRFAAEIAGVEELGLLGRGSNSEIGTYINKVLTSELSGNMIDLCPVGAFTATSKKLNKPPVSGTGMMSVYVHKNQIELVKDYDLDFKNCGRPCNNLMNCGAKTKEFHLYLETSPTSPDMIKITITYCTYNTTCSRCRILKDINIVKRPVMKDLIFVGFREYLADILLDLMKKNLKNFLSKVYDFLKNLLKSLK